MAISFNTGTAVNSGGSQPASLNLTIPAGVLSGDVMLLIVEAFFASGFTPTVASTGTAFTQIGSTQFSNNTSGLESSGSIWFAVASGSDAGKVITASGNSCFWALALVAYTGASNTTPIDVSGGAAGTSSAATTIGCPSETTGVSGDWAVYLSAWTTTNPPMTVPGGTTSRENSQASGVGVAISDSNGSVGPAGTGIGGVNFTAGTGPNWLTAFTVGLAPPTAGVNGTVQPRTAAPAPRRRPARAVVGFTPVTTVNAPPAPVSQQHPQTVYRRRPARAWVQFTPVTTVNFIPVFVPVAAPRQPATFPRRRPARAVVRFTPVTTTNPAPIPPVPVAAGADYDEAREFKRWLLWEV